MIVLVGLAGGLGATLRWIASGWMAARRGRGAGTAAVNLVGSLALGVLVGLLRTGRISEDMMVVAGVGLLGGFTTFSTWKVEVVEDSASSWAAIGRTVPVLAGGLELAWLGMVLAGGFK